jgi:hypothetical protein
MVNLRVNLLQVRNLLKLAVEVVFQNRIGLLLGLANLYWTKPLEINGMKIEHEMNTLIYKDYYPSRVEMPEKIGGIAT